MYNSLKKTGFQVFILMSISFCLISVTRGHDGLGLEQKYFLNSDKFIMVNGTRVRVREEGPKDGPPLVLIHGFTASLETWDGWASRLNSKYRIFRYDLLGHGLTGPDEMKRYSPAERAKFLLDLLDALKLDRVSLAGNSLGGLIAWKFAVSNPQRVENLILVSSGAYSINGVKDKPLPVPGALVAYFKQPPEMAVKFSFGRLFSDPAKVTNERLGLYWQMMRRQGNGQAFIDHIEEFTLPDPSDELKKITAPTLILWGKKDNIIPVEQAGWLHKNIPHSRLITHDDLGHMPHEEAPERTASQILEFLDHSKETKNR